MRRIADIEKQTRRGKAVLRELKSTLENLEDRRELAAAKKRNAGKPGTSLRDAAKELGCNPCRKSAETTFAMKTHSRSCCFAILAATSLALCFPVQLRAEKKPAPAAKTKQLTAEERKIREKANDLLNRGDSLHNQGKYAEAEKLFRAELPIRKRIGGAEDSSTLGCRHNLAILQYERGRYAEAEKEFRALLAIRERVLGAKHYETILSRLPVAAVLLAKNKKAEAEKEFRALLADMQRAPDVQAWDVYRCQLGLANAVQAQGRNAEAEKEYREILKSMEGTAHPYIVLEAQINLAIVLTDQGKHAEAEREYRAMLSVREEREQLYQKFESDVFMNNYDLALCLKAQGKIKEALPLIQRAETGLNKVLGSEHPDSKEAKQEREDIEAELKKQQAGGK